MQRAVGDRDGEAVGDEGPRDAVGAFGVVRPTGRVRDVAQRQRPGAEGVDEAAAAIQEIEADYARASAHATEVAREHFAADRVLRALLAIAGF